MDDSKEKLLNPTVVKLGMISLFADIASEMLYPVMPIFLTTVLGASKASVGLIEGVAEAVASLLKTYSGAWSDRIGRRQPFIFVGYLLAALSKPVIGFAGAWPVALVARAADRAGKGLRGGPRDALLSEAVSPRLRGAAFGWHRAMDTIGAAIGPLLAIAYLSLVSENLRHLFMLATIPGVIAAVIALGLSDKTAPPRRSSQSKVSFGSMPVMFRRYLVSWGLFSIGNSSDVFLLLKARESGLSLNATIFIYCLYNLIYALFSPAFGRLSDRIDRRWVLAAGFLVFAFVYSGFAIATQTWEFTALFAIYGVYMAATDGVGKAFAIDLVDSDTKATAVGLLGTITGLTTLIASFTAGELWDHFGTGLPFFYGAAASILATLSLLFVHAAGPTLRK